MASITASFAVPYTQAGGAGETDWTRNAVASPVLWYVSDTNPAQNSKTLKAQNASAGLGDLPDDATIVGLKVTITRYDPARSTEDVTIQLIDDTGAQVGDNKETDVIWTAAPSAIDYGGETDLWGQAAGWWTPAKLKDADFGVAIQVLVSYLPTANTAYLQENVTVTVYYTEAAAEEARTMGYGILPVYPRKSTCTNEKYPIWTPPNCILHYTMTDMSPATGKILDHGPYKLNGTSVGSVYATGPNGIVRSFDGTSDYISVAANSNLQWTAMTCLAWIKRSTASADRTIYCSKTSGGLHFRLYRDNQLELLHSDTAQIGVSITTVGTNWSLAGCTYVPTTGAYEIYIDGVRTATGTSIKVITFDTQFVGAKSATEEEWDSLMGEFMLFNKVLDQQEILAYYRHSAPRYDVG